MIACSQLLLYPQECETFVWSEEEHDTKRKRKSDEPLFGVKKNMIQKGSEKAMSTWVLVLTSLAACMISLDSQVVATALSTIRLHLGASIEELEWTVNAYTLSFAVLLMTGAALGDRFGRRRLFIAGLGLFVLASAACALAPNAGWLIAARAHWRRRPAHSRRMLAG